MTARIAVLLVSIVAFSFGCSSDPGQRTGTATDVNGTVASADGKPVGNVRLNFFPTSAKELPASFDLKADGKFTVKLIPAKYTFAFEPSGNGAGFRAIPAAYQSNSADHAVTVEAGKDLKLEVK